MPGDRRKPKPGKPLHHYDTWSDEQILRLSELTEQGYSAKQVAQILGRTTHTVNRARQKFGLVTRPTTCLQCGGPITDPGTGRPKKYCTQDCAAKALDEARVERLNALREAARQARTDWTCLQCGVELTRDDPKRIYCSMACARRAHYERRKAGETSPRRKPKQ